MSTKNSDEQIVLNLATPVARIRARFTDLLVFIIIFVVLQFIVGAAFGTTLLMPGMSPRRGYYLLNSFDDFFLISAIFGVVVSLIYAFLFIIVPSFIFKGQTLGKKALGIKLMREDGEEVEIIDLVKREILRVLLVMALFIPFVNAFSCLGILLLTLCNLSLIFVDERNKTVYDMVGQTIVVEA